MNAVQPCSSDDPMTQQHKRSGSQACCRSMQSEKTVQTAHRMSETRNLCFLQHEKLKGQCHQGALLTVCCYLESSGFPTILLVLTKTIQVIKAQVSARGSFPTSARSCYNFVATCLLFWSDGSNSNTSAFQLLLSCCDFAVILHIQISCVSPGVVTLLLVPRQVWSNTPSRQCRVTSS